MDMPHKFDKLEKQRKKQVRFSGDAESDDEEEKRIKAPLFPKGKKSKNEDSILDTQSDSNLTVLSVDARIAAKERAKRRFGSTDVKKFEDTDVLDDVAEAEEEFEEDAFDDTKEFEPFNLKKEREEGYFDADGNYVEYRMQNEFKDAWLDSIDQSNTNFDDDENKKMFEKKKQNMEEVKPLTSFDIAKIKKRMAGVLEPGETVLQGLKRLGGSKKLSSPKSFRDKKSKSQTEKVKMSPKSKMLFDQLTEDAMNLLDNGEFGVYSESKETFEREAAGYESLARARGEKLFEDEKIEKNENTLLSNSESQSQSQIMDSNAHESNLKLNSNSNSNTDSNKRKFDMFDDEEEGEKEKEKEKEEEKEKEDGKGSENEETEKKEEEGKNGNKIQKTEKENDIKGFSNSGYVFDESSGYYYNQESGYFYEPNSQLFLNSSTNIWYQYDESTNSYVEVPNDSN